jgi:ATP-dependent DNA ligase
MCGTILPNGVRAGRARVRIWFERFKTRRRLHELGARELVDIGLTERQRRCECAKAREAASDSGNAAALVFFLFDLLYLDGKDLLPRPLIDRKTRLAALLSNVASPLHYCDHQIGHGREFHKQACAMSLEGIVSKRADAPYTPGNRGLWLKIKCLHREEFVVIGWTDPEGARPFLGALLLGYYDPHGRLVFAGRVGSGINQAELQRLWRRLQPLATEKMPLEVPPPRSSRFGSPLVLSSVHWVTPELVVEVKYLAWTGDSQLRQVVYEGLREDKPAGEVRREVPRPQASNTE